MNFILDTNILLIYLRDKEQRKQIEELYHPFDKTNTPILSVVSVGELWSIAKRNQWGTRKVNTLIGILDTLLITDINTEDVINQYAEIDAFSQAKLQHKPLGVSARNMGKNDLWIAATASVLEAKLLTTDKDFNHLHQVYVDVGYIQL